MKRKDKEQLLKKSDKELQDQLTASRDKLWLLKRDLKAGKVKNVREIKHLRRNVARMLTLLQWRKQHDN
jgi:ribosomal protein L29